MGSSFDDPPCCVTVVARVRRGSGGVEYASKIIHDVSCGESMASILIGYDLNKPEKDYDDLIAAIKENFGTWWHHLDSTWIVKTEQTVVEVRDLLKAHIDANDELLVVALTGAGAWMGFNKRGSDWLKNNL